MLNLKISLNKYSNFLILFNGLANLKWIDFMSNQIKEIDPVKTNF
jgi:hypothetical protein